ncbi:hypothetical protein MNR01_16485 [Lysobacter sp. S4-A87]|uniref:hypothetical protein n=1 Tax=Lysobacter sp. S4-A87 TaxID=2925843 RepID=UPI001F532F36|nr:hypothetical protein [Lysobacter sp. S4-A87]UNK49300.1 hypothetical protein MNR01_16485 [Lysobacter sp. S4-A87]
MRGTRELAAWPRAGDPRGQAIEGNTMGRTILGMLVGVVVAVAVIMLVEMLGHSAYPPPAGLDITDPANEAAFAAFIAQMPPGAKAMVLLAWLLGTFTGALVGAKIARHQTAAALLVALVVISGVLGMILKFPHPGWLSVCGLVLPIPTALLAVRLVYRRTTLPRV